MSLVNNLLFNGALLLSGLLEEDEHDILAEAAKYSLEYMRTTKKNGWIAIQFLKK